MKLLKITTIILLLGLVNLLFFVSCNSGFLDYRQNQNLSIPNTIEDFQAMLDNDLLMNGNSVGLLGFIGGDEYYATDDIWTNARVDYERNAYIWDDEIYMGQPVPDWDYGYKRILHTNIVLEGLEKLNDGEKQTAPWRLAKGSALFFRAYNFFELAQIFSPPYPISGNGSGLGIPLRLEPDITARTERSTIKETYERILIDLKSSLPLLPVEPLILERPSRPAALAMLARVSLQMGKYEEALAYSDSCLFYKNKLLDFSDIDTSGSPENIFDDYIGRHPEVIFMTTLQNSSLAIPYLNLRVDTLLRSLYGPNDLRETVYFWDDANGYQWFRGSYQPIGSWFGGLAVDEVILIKAECHARLGDPQNALTQLNLLLSHRISRHAFNPLTLSDPSEILSRIITERKKELVFRGRRWSDLRRLNQESQFETVIHREIDGKSYELMPNSPRYTWPIPDEVILQSGIPQNER